MHSKADLLAGISFPKMVQEPLTPMLPKRFISRKTPHFRGSKSGYMGVVFDERMQKHSWKAYIRYHGQYRTLGRFKTKEEAALEFNKEAKRIFGDSAYLNKVHGIR